MPDLQSGHRRAVRKDGAADTVSQDAWGGDCPGSPTFPAVDVHIGAADPSVPDVYQGLGGAGGADGNVNQLQAWAGVRLREGQHGFIVPQRFNALPPGRTCWCVGKVVQKTRLSPQLVLQGVDGILRGEQVCSGHFPVTLDGLDPSILTDQCHQLIAFCRTNFSWSLLQGVIS